MSDQAAPGQLLHLVFGGELADFDRVEFKDLDKLDIVGVYPNYATAYAAWKAKAQQTVDNAHMRYFIVHLHRLLDPETDRRAEALTPSDRHVVAQASRRARARSRRRPASRRPNTFAWCGTRRGSSTSPQDMYAHAETLMPVIIGMWHGQHFLAPFLRRGHPAKVLISRHRDGEINAIAAEHLGVETIRGSGAHGREFQRKGGVGAFREMLDALAQGYNVALSADVPKVVARRRPRHRQACQRCRAGRSTWSAIATRRRIDARTTGIAPRSTCRSVAAPSSAYGPIYVPADADEAALEAARRTVESELNAVDRARLRDRRRAVRARGDGRA